MSASVQCVYLGDSDWGSFVDFVHLRDDVLFHERLCTGVLIQLCPTLP